MVCLCCDGEYGIRGSVSVFDITQIPFRLVVAEMKLGMRANHLCYCDLPGVDDALAVADGSITSDRNKLSMFSLKSGGLLWSVGNKNERGQSVKVVGAVEWRPEGVCSDNSGRLYVADNKYGNNRIIIFAAGTGSLLQVIQGRGHRGIHYYWVAEPGIKVFGPDIKYRDDKPEKGVVSGSVLQEIKHSKLGLPRYISWDENTKSVIVYCTTGTALPYRHCLNYLQIVSDQGN